MYIVYYSYIYFIVLENNLKGKIVDANSSIDSFTINGRTNLTFNLRPNKFLDR